MSLSDALGNIGEIRVENDYGKYTLWFFMKHTLTRKDMIEFVDQMARMFSKLDNPNYEVSFTMDSQNDYYRYHDVSEDTVNSVRELWELNNVKFK